MSPELGQFALILALLLAFVQFTLPIYGAWRGNATLIGLARPVVAGQAVFVVLAFALLTYAARSSRRIFPVVYVAQNLEPVAAVVLPLSCGVGRARRDRCFCGF